MPDLNIVVMQQCSNNLRHYQIGGYDQTVAYSERDVTRCTCEGFRWRHHCKHIEQAMPGLCSWHEQNDGPPEVNGVCPKCGSPTELVKVAV